MLKYKNFVIDIYADVKAPVLYNFKKYPQFIKLPETEFLKGKVYNLNHKNAEITSIILKNLALLLEPKEGTVRIDNINLSFKEIHDNPALRENLTFVFKDAILLSNLSIRENLMLSLNFYHPEKTQNEKYDRIISFVKKYELYDYIDYRPAEISKSLLKLFSLIRVFTFNSQYIIFDSPFFLLDYQESQIFNQVLQDFISDKCYIVSTGFPVMLDYISVDIV